MSRGGGDAGQLADTVLALISGRHTPADAARQGGWPSQEAFERACRRSYGVAPADWGALARTGHYRFAYGGPFHPSRTLAYLGRDPESLSEYLREKAYTRHFPSSPQPGRGRDALPVPVTLVLGARHCEVRLPPGLSPATLLHLHTTIRRFLGLEQPLPAFYRLTRSHPVLGPLVKALPGVRMPQLPTLWEALSWAVLGQQINLGFAYRLRNRLIGLAAGAPPAGAPPGGAAPSAAPNAAPTGALTAADRPVPFPTPRQVLAIPPQTLRANQFSRQKTEYLGLLAQACLEGELAALAPGSTPPEEAERAMLAVKGIGRWSAAYGLMRALGHLDALPVGDAGLRTALHRGFGLAEPPDISRQEALMEPFRPFRALATYYLWKSLDTAANE